MAALFRNVFEDVVISK